MSLGYLRLEKIAKSSEGRAFYRPKDLVKRKSTDVYQK
jgi:hypothetical protein